MFAVEIPAFAFNARFSGRNRRVNSRNDHAMKHELPNADPQSVIVDALARMLPSTTAEIAEACGLEADATAACLDRLAGRCQVMFNPLTKRYSLPKRHPAGIAA